MGLNAQCPWSARTSASSIKEKAAGGTSAACSLVPGRRRGFLLVLSPALPCRGARLTIVMRRLG